MRTCCACRNGSRNASRYCCETEADAGTVVLAPSYRCITDSTTAAGRRGNLSHPGPTQHTYSLPCARAATAMGTQAFKYQFFSFKSALREQQHV
jgi:hypothetical protein